MATSLKPTPRCAVTTARALSVATLLALFAIVASPSVAGAVDDATITGVVFDDVNGDGTINGADAARAGLTVELVEVGSGTVVDTTVTDGLGAYTLTVDGSGLPLDHLVRVSGLSASEAFSSGPDSDVSNVWDDPIDGSGEAVVGEFVLVGLAPNATETVDAMVRQTPTVSGSVWADTDVDGVLDDSGDPDGAALEGPATDVTVELVDPNDDSIIATTTIDAAGDYLFDTVPDGTWDVVFTSTNTFFGFNDGAAGNDTTEDPAVLGEPRSARTSITVSGTDASVVGSTTRPLVTLDAEIIPAVGIQDGTAPFDTFGTCPTLTAGDDCGDDDGVIRTNDVVTFPISVTADGVPDIDGSGNIEDDEKIGDVILEMTVSPSDAPDPVSIVEFSGGNSGIPTICRQGGAYSPSSTIVDNLDGSFTLLCNLGDFGDELKFFSVSVRALGGSENLSSISTTSRVYQSRDEAIPPTTPLPDTVHAVSASPQFNLTKSTFDGNANNRLISHGVQERVNPETGITEYGYGFQYEMSVVVPPGGRGVEPVETMTFTEQIDSQFSGALLVACYNEPYNSSSTIPRGGDQPDGSPSSDDNRVADSGTWTCDQPSAGADITVTITGADTTAAHLPTEGYNGNDLSAGPFYVAVGRVYLWYPMRDLSDILDDGLDNDSWNYGDTDVFGTVSVTNCVVDFAPTSAGGTQNFGGLNEPYYGESDGDPAPAGDNCRAHDIVITDSGSYWKGYRATGYETWGTGHNWITGLPPNASADHSGDGAVYPGEIFVAGSYYRNSGVVDQSGIVICETVDTAVMRLADIPGITGTDVAVLALTHDDTGLYKLQYLADAGGFNNDHGHDQTPDPVSGHLPVDTTNQDAASVCDDAAGTWFDDIASVPGGSDAVTRLRVVPVDWSGGTSSQVLKPTEYVGMVIGLEARNTFNGGPADEDGELIPVGTLLVDHSGYRNRNGTWVESSYDPMANTGTTTGDRIALNRVQVRVTKSATLLTTGDDLMFAQDAGLDIEWVIQPAVTSGTGGDSVAEDVRIVDVLPQYVTYDPTCTPAPPAGYAGPVVTAGPGAGETTLEWSLGDRIANVALDPIILCTNTSSVAPNGYDALNAVTISAVNDSSGAAIRTAERTVELQQSGGFQLEKSVDQPLDFENDTQVFTLTWSNFSDVIPIEAPYIYDVFGHNGDGPSTPAAKSITSTFTGQYVLDAMPTASTAGTFEFSADDPATISNDHREASNQPGGSTTWCSSSDGVSFTLVQGSGACPATLADATALRFVSAGQLPPSGLETLSFTMQAGDPGADPGLINDAGDRYTNRFAAWSNSFPDQLVRSNTVIVQVVSFTLGDLVFADVNYDGAYTAGLDLLAPAGVTVELWEDGGSSAFDTTTTDANGRFTFVDIAGGDLELRIPASEFQGGGLLENWTVSAAAVADPDLPDPGANENVDHHAQTAGTEAVDGVTSGVVTLEANATPNPAGGEPLFDDVYPWANAFYTDDFTNYTVDFGLVAPGAVAVQKEICIEADLANCDVADDADWAETQEVPFFTNSAWRVTVTNTGSQILSPTYVDDELEDACDATFDGSDLPPDAPHSPSGTASVTHAGLQSLGLGESTAYVCESSQVVEELTNSADAIGTAADGTTVTASDTADVTLPPPNPLITVEKSTNTLDADSLPGVYLDTGDAIIWEYVVTTTGNVPLTDVEVVDDMGTPGTPGDDITLSKATSGYVSGDTDGDDVLDLDETWIFQLGGVASSGQYTNVATATGTPVAPSLSDVNDTDASNHTGLDDAPSIDVEVATNGDDADVASGPLVNTGSTVTWTYTVTTNGADVPLSAITLVDDAGTPGDAGDDFSPTYQSGDTDADGILDEGETWIFTATGSAGDGQFTNTVEATGTPPETTDSSGVTTQPADVSDTDPTNHFAVVGAVDVQKSTNGEDADTGFGPVVATGSTVTWTFAVENTGNVDLADVTVTDDQVAALDIDCGAPDNDNVIDTILPGDIVTCTATGTAVTGQHANTASVTGNPVLSGGDIAGVPDATAADDSHYFAFVAGVDIEKSTDGADADSAPGPYITTGDTVTWTFVVENTGDVDLADVTVTDDVIAAVDIDCGAPDNDNVIELLEPGALNAVTCTATGPAGDGAHVNTASVTGNPVDDSGTDVPGVTDPTDSDDSHHFAVVATVDIEVATNTVDADTGFGPAVATGSTVTWTFVVENTGNVDLADVTVTDDQLADVDIDCGAPDNDNVVGTMLPGDIVTCTATGTATAGQYENNGSVVGNPVVSDVDIAGIADATDTDPSHHFGLTPSIDIEKSTDGADADSAPGPYITTGDTVTWTFVVENTGDVDLADVTVTDDVIAAVDIDCGAPDNDNVVDSLAPGAIVTCTATGPAGDGAHVNTASVTGNPVDGGGTDVPGVTDPTDSDDSHHFAVVATVDLEKSTNTVDADVAPGPLVAEGSPVVWEFVVENTGNVDLADVTVFDDLVAATDIDCGGPDNDNVIDVLAVGAIVTCTASGVAGDSAYVNTGGVAGTAIDPLGDPIVGIDPAADSDLSNHLGAAPSIDIETLTQTFDADEAPGPVVPIGDPVLWSYVVTNDGNVDLTNIVVLDDVLADDAVDIDCGGGDNTIALLVPGASVTCTATGVAVAGPYANVGSVTADSAPTVGTDGSPVVGVGVSDDDPTNHLGSDPAIEVQKFVAGDDADVDPVWVVTGATVPWRYEVTNVGSSPLSNVTVVDDAGTSSDTGDDWTLDATDVISGDLDGDQQLDPGETWIMNASGTAFPGDYENTALASGTSPDTTDSSGVTTPGSIHTSSDIAKHFAASPAVTIEKSVNGDEADTAPGPYVQAGETVFWTYVVTNTGDVALAGIEVTDDQGLEVICPGTVLAAGESMGCTASGPAASGAYVNVGTVTSTAAQPHPTEPASLIPIVDPVTGEPEEPYTADDEAHLFGVDPSFEVNKWVCVVEGCDPAVPEYWHTETGAIQGQTLQWLVRVTNTGNVDLHDIEVTDELATGCSISVSTLEPGESVDARCSSLLDGGTASNSVTVNAAGVSCNADGSTLGCSDVEVSNPDPDRSASVAGPADIDLEKGVDDDTPRLNQIVQFTVAVTNQGGSAAQDVDLSDQLPADLEFVRFVEQGSALYDEGTRRIEWILERLDPGASTRIVYETRVIGDENTTNVVEVIRDGFTIILGDDQAQETVEVEDEGDTAPDGGDGDVGDGGLARSGADSDVIAMIAVAMVLVGVAIVLAVRRRDQTPAAAD